MIEVNGSLPGLECQNWRLRLAKLEEEVKLVKEEIQKTETRCPHRWFQQYTPMEFAAYTIPAQELGSDSTPETYVPARSVPFWTRTCTECGKVEKTGCSSTVKDEKEVPIWKS